MGQEPHFIGLNLETSGRLTAYLKAGVVRIEATEEDRKRPAGWYLNNWTPVPDPVTEKFAKGQVEYGPGCSGSECGECVHFFDPNGCAKVSGRVAPSAWCRLFKSKGSTDE